MSKSQVVIIIFFGLLTVAIIGAIVVVMSQPIPAVPIPVELPSPTLTFTVTQTRLILPATWTPAPTEIPSITPTRPTSTATATVQPIVTFKPMDTLNIPPSAVVLTGNSSQNTSIFSLPEGTVTVNWTYYGVPGEGSEVEYAYNSYQIDLDYENRTYQIWDDYYQNIIQRALEDQDAFAIMNAQNSLSQYTNRYNTNVASAKARYDSVVAAHTTPFKATLYRSSTGSGKLILSVKGLYEGSFKLKTTKASDYYLVVETPGQWSIRILP